MSGGLSTDTSEKKYDRRSFAVISNRLLSIFPVSALHRPGAVMDGVRLEAPLPSSWQMKRPDQARRGLTVYHNIDQVQELLGLPHYREPSDSYLSLVRQ